MSAARAIRLPQSLIEQLGDTAGSGNNYKRHENRQFSRKESRKKDRLDRKLRKAEYFSVPPSTKRHAEEEHPASPKRRKIQSAASSRKSVPMPVKASQIQQQVTRKPSNHGTSTEGHVNAKIKPKGMTTLDKLVSPSEPSSKPTAHRQNGRGEDEYEAYLEAKLGYGKAGKQKVRPEGDGLDDLLDLASSLVTSRALMAQSASQSDSDTDSHFNGPSIMQDVSDHDTECSDAEEWFGFENAVDRIEMPSETPLRSIPDSISTGIRYIPPHLRNQHEDDFEAVQKIRRQLKGLLNRMSEQNLESILDSIEEIYREHRRHDVTSTLTTLIIDGISSHSILLDSYVVLYAALVSCLHKIMGIDFAAYFVQNVVMSYEQHHSVLLHSESSGPETMTMGKECTNLIVLLSELYNFQVISCVLVFDVIRGLLDEQLTEFDVELLLKIVRNSGHQLRQDDPAAVKDIITIVQTKVSTQDDTLSSRSRFMIETLTNLKNNKLKRNVSQNQGGEAVERMKKFLSGLKKKHHILAHEPLRVSLFDLHSAESKGKWWLVGSAWAGDPIVDRAKTAPFENEQAGDNALLKLAKKQGMNTDIRRSIFVVIMTSDDYVDACERLAQLNLTEVQQREIVRVLLHCCGNEKTYNPYYTLVCQHLCQSSHSYKVTLQFCLWDFLRDLGEDKVGGAEVLKNSTQKGGQDSFNVKNISNTRMRNVAKAYAWWIAKNCSSLTILKPVDFTVLKPQTREFFKEFLMQVIISSQAATPVLSSNQRNQLASRNRGAVEEIFIKATKIEMLAMGLMYFMSEAFRGELGDSEGVLEWGINVAKDTLRTDMDTIPTI